MKQLFKNLKKKKKSIASFSLALVLMLSFNYSPISLISNKFKSNAYLSESTKNYYESTSIKTESNISLDSSLDYLKEYFSDSDINYNILSNYTTRFDEIFKEKVHSFMLSLTSNNFSTKYQEFLEDKNCNTLYNYYNANSSNIKTNFGCESYKQYFEYFLSHVTEWTHENEVKSTVVIDNFNSSNSMYRSNIYCSLANYLNSEQVSVSGTDGLNDNSDFYTDSVSYKRVKTFINNIIAETMPISTNDGTTQNKYVASIIAKDAPTSLEYSYVKNSYDVELIPKFSYVMVPASETKESKPHVYTLDSLSSLTNLPGYEDGYFSSITEAELEENYTKYKIVTPSDDFGYIEGHVTFYRYESVPYALQNSSSYAVYVVDDDVDEEEQITYDTLYYNVISSDTLSQNSNFFVQIPYLESSNIFFKKYSGLADTSSTSITFSNYINLFTTLEGSQKVSKIYLKLQEKESPIVYINTASGTSKQVFLDSISDYSYTVEEVDLTSSEVNENDYYKIESTLNNTYTGIYQESYDLYLKKSIDYFTELDTSDDAYAKDGGSYIYETTKSPNVSYKTTTIADVTYEEKDNQKQIFVLNDTEVNGYSPISEDDLMLVNNLYVEVPKAVSDKLNKDSTTAYKYYYKHKTKTVNEVFLVLQGEKDSADNEVYKTLNYTVLTSAEYNANYDDYIIIGEGDANYNKNFKLYYKKVTAADKDLYVQNKILDSNARFYVLSSGKTISSLDSTTVAKLKAKNITVITYDEFTANQSFYTQISELDTENWDSEYTVLYFKYRPLANSDKRVLYIDSSKTHDVYQTFNSSSTNFVASDYELVQSDDPNYVEGTNLYYKKIRSEKYETLSGKDSVYYYKSTSTELKADSYYAISFYVYTNGNYDSTHPVEASVNIVDANDNIKDIKIEGISTEGKWQKYTTFIATNPITTSSITMYFYMGNQDSILGSASSLDIKTVTGKVFFDEIKITKINATDYDRCSIDYTPVYSTPMKDAEDNNIAGRYVDEYKNEVFVTNKDSRFNLTNTFYNRINSEIVLWNNQTFTETFDFDTTDFNFNDLEFINGTDGFTDYADMWQHYISRDVSGQGNEFSLSNYQLAYQNNKLTASIVKESDIDKTIIKEETDEDEEEKDEEKTEEDADKENDENTNERTDVKTVTSTFNDDNKVLKLENKDKILTLGVTSNHFEIKQMQYYKLTVWIYSNQERAQAAITLHSSVKTLSAPQNGTSVSTTATLDACIEKYDEKQTNEYSWIPVTFYIKGSSLHDQNCYLALQAADNCTVYFDNITLEPTTSALYTTASSDSINTTYTLALTPTASLLTSSVTDGYFDAYTVTNNYSSIMNPNIDYTIPRTAEKWTAESTNSSSVIAGIVPTSDDYTENYDFFDKYNNDGTNTIIPYSYIDIVPTGDRIQDAKTNVYAIYAPSLISSPIDKDSPAAFKATNRYSIKSSSLSLSASTIYKISFQFYAGVGFDGNMVATLTHGTSDNAKILTKISDNTFNSGWNTYTMYVKTGTSSATIYLNIGIENAVGTCFFQKVTCNSDTTVTSLDAARDQIISSSDNTDNNLDLNNKASLENYKFVDLTDTRFTIFSDKNETNGLYSNTEYTTTLVNNKDYTVGEFGTVIASYYETSETNSYTVEINKVTYYIKEFKDKETGALSYKLYSDSNYKNLVEDINGKAVTISDNKTVTVGNNTTTDYDIVTTTKTNYEYKFTEDLTINNNIIPAEELNNSYSQNVMIISNSYSTDYTIATPQFSNSLKTSAFYVLKIYVKTSDFDSEEFGLTINVKSLSKVWENVNTTKIDSDDKDDNGFVCYQILLDTQSTSLTGLSVTFSIGDEDTTGAGYAIIAGAVIETIANQTLFNEYSENYDENDTLVYKFKGKVSSSSSSNSASSSNDDEDDGSMWATFFYIFSSLLLGIILIMALVAVIIKKHPIKTTKKPINEHNRDGSFAISTKSAQDLEEETAETEPKMKKSSKTKKPESDSDEGFV